MNPVFKSVWLNLSVYVESQGRPTRFLIEKQILPFQNYKQTPDLLPHALFLPFFNAFRLKFINNQLQEDGFCHPEDSTNSDLSLWLPRHSNGSYKIHAEDCDYDVTEIPQLDLEACKYLLKCTSNTFCGLVKEEKEALHEAARIHGEFYKFYHNCIGISNNIRVNSEYNNNM